ncbi:MAG: helix-turn-helix domain-containing protein [Verrucomicrobiales bacterium]|nr:helix-turn-helix domain-containing protein [Verrucomicrobiales bacterium]
MSAETAAAYLDLSLTAFRKLANEGGLGAVQFNPKGDRRWLKADLDDYLYRLREQGRATPRRAG